MATVKDLQEYAFTKQLPMIDKYVDGSVKHAPKISPSELSLPRETRRTLAQLRTNKSPILIYLHQVDETHHPSPLCPLCKTHPQTTFSTAHTYIPQAIYWTSGCLRESGAPADQVEEAPGMASLEKLGCRTPPQLYEGGVGQQQHGSVRAMVSMMVRGGCLPVRGNTRMSWKYDDKHCVCGEVE